MAQSAAEEAFARWCFGEENVFRANTAWMKPSVEDFKVAVRGMYWDRLLKRRKSAMKNLEKTQSAYAVAWERKSFISIIKCCVSYANVFLDTTYNKREITSLLQKGKRLIDDLKLVGGSTCEADVASVEEKLRELVNVAKDPKVAAKSSTSQIFCILAAY